MARSLAKVTWYAIAALVTTTAVIGAMTSHPVVLAFGVIGLATGVVAVIWNRLALQELSYERVLPQQIVFRGEEIPMTVALSNNKPVPLAWLRLEDDIPEALQIVAGDEPRNVKPNVQTLHHSTSMKWYEKLRWRYQLLCTQRGLYHIGPAYIESGDPFGVLHSRRSQPRQDTILVYPQVFTLDELGVPSSRPFGDVLGGARIYQDPTRPSGIRDYERGDPLKTVDWKATARVQRLQVRTYEPSITTTVVLVVAVDTREPYWDRYERQDLERVLTVAASMASYAVGREYATGLFTNDMPVQIRNPLTVPPARGREQLRLVLGALATVRLYAIQPMAITLAEHSHHFPMGATVVVVTAFMPAIFVSALSELRGRGHKVTVLHVGAEACPDLGESIMVHELRDHLVEMEEAGELLAS